MRRLYLGKSHTDPILEDPAAGDPSHAHTHTHTHTHLPTGAARSESRAHTHTLTHLPTGAARSESRAHTSTHTHLPTGAADPTDAAHAHAARTSLPPRLFTVNGVTFYSNSLSLSLSLSLSRTSLPSLLSASLTPASPCIPRKGRDAHPHLRCSPCNSKRGSAFHDNFALNSKGPCKRSRCWGPLPF